MYHGICEGQTRKAINVDVVGSVSLSCALPFSLIFSLSRVYSLAGKLAGSRGIGRTAREFVARHSSGGFFSFHRRQGGVLAADSARRTIQFLCD